MYHRSSQCTHRSHKRNLGSLAQRAVLVAITTFVLNCSYKAQGQPPAFGTQPKNNRIAMMSPQFNPIASHENHVYVANTPNHTLDVIDKAKGEVIQQIPVGIEPVGLAIRPDGLELWVVNHVSDSISVIDLNATHPTYHQVAHTIQDHDPKSKATRFDEPVGVVFANNDKAYVSLSSENEIAVIDVATRSIQKRLKIPAQDPRGLAVRNGKLFVIPFESNNQTQLSGGRKEDIDGNLVTFDAWDHSIANNNVLSIGHVVDIVKNPNVPDRDLFVFDTNNDELIEVVSSLGTLLYGIAVDAQNRVYIAQTDARNDVNGRAGTQKHGLAQLENRPFLNRVTRVDWDNDNQAQTSWYDLEPLPPLHPTTETALATPYAVEVSRDGGYLYSLAAGSDTLFILDTQNGSVLGRCSVGAVPQGICIDYRNEQPAFAWVLNAAENSVTLVDVTEPTNPRVIQNIPLTDPTDTEIKAGRIAFTTARGSTTGTFSCASCHPDGHTDQLLWVLATPIVTGGNQIMPRSTMPVRGLRDTAPFHWDGIPGDPYGGIHSASIRQGVNPNSDVSLPETTTRHLIDGGLGSTMAMVGDKTTNDEGKAGTLSAKERDAMAKFLLNVPYPPAQRRAFDNRLSNKAIRGFRLFHVDGDLDPSKPKPNVCGDCHRMPHWVSTNTPGTGMDAPTWRGAYDRWLILPQGRLNIIAFDFFKTMIEQGAPERSVWQMSWAGRPRFDPVWDMVLEGSTGFPGSYARQVTLNQNTSRSPTERKLLDALLEAAKQQTVDLQGSGIRIENGTVTRCNFYTDLTDGSDPHSSIRFRIGTSENSEPVTADELIQLADEGKLVLTLTADLGVEANSQKPQPEIWTSGNIQQQRGRQVFPIATNEEPILRLSGRYFGPDAWLIVDGLRVKGSIEPGEKDEVLIQLDQLPDPGMHFLQVQVPHGFVSNDFIFYTAKDRSGAIALRERIDEPHSEGGAIRRILENPTKINDRMANGSTPLSQAALWGQLSLVRELLDNGAEVNLANADGNTALHLASFMCHKEVIELLLENDADWRIKNKRGETPRDVVQGKWTEELAELYRQIGVSLGIPIDTIFLERTRPIIANSLLQAETE